MGECILIGGGFALAAALQPGPLQAFLFASVARKGWRHTLPAALSPLLSDGPIALLVLLVLNRLPVTLGRGLQGAGGVFLLYLAWASYRQWRRNESPRPGDDSSAPRWLGSRSRRMLILVSALTLAALGVYQLAASVWRPDVSQPAPPAARLGEAAMGSSFADLLQAGQVAAAD